MIPSGAPSSSRRGVLAVEKCRISPRPRSSRRTSRPGQRPDALVDSRSCAPVRAGTPPRPLTQISPPPVLPRRAGGVGNQIAPLAVLDEHQIEGFAHELPQQLFTRLRQGRRVRRSLLLGLHRPGPTAIAIVVIMRFAMIQCLEDGRGPGSRRNVESVSIAPSWFIRIEISWPCSPDEPARPAASRDRAYQRRPAVALFLLFIAVSLATPGGSWASTSWMSTRRSTSSAPGSSCVASTSTRGSSISKPPLLYVYYAAAQLLFGRGMLAVHLATVLITVPLTALGVSAFFRHDRRGVIAGHDDPDLRRGVHRPRHARRQLRDFLDAAARDLGPRRAARRRARRGSALGVSRGRPAGDLRPVQAAGCRLAAGAGRGSRGRALEQGELARRPPGRALLWGLRRRSRSPGSSSPCAAMPRRCSTGRSSTTSVTRNSRWSAARSSCAWPSTWCPSSWGR